MNDNNNIIEEFNKILPQIEKLVGDIVGNTSIVDAEIYLSGTNDLMICMYDSVIYSTTVNFNTIGDIFLGWKKDDEGNISIRELGYRNGILIEYYDKYIKMYNINPDLNIICSIDNVEQLDTFPNKLKASDGCEFIKVLGNDMKTYMLPIFTGFPKLNKGDTMDIRIFRLTLETNIVKYIIHKKKLNRDIVISFRSLNFS